jgi:hypothetical protein
MHIIAVLNWAETGRNTGGTCSEGTLMEKGNSESFHGQLREDRLKTKWFDNLNEN